MPLHSVFMLASFITFAHFAVSAVILSAKLRVGENKLE